MKGLAITHRGAEGISAKEIMELINSEPEIRESACIFGIRQLKDLCLLCYAGHSFIKILYFIDAFEFDTLDSMVKKFNNKNILNEISKWIKNKKYKLECKRAGSHNFNSQDASIRFNEAINKKSQIEYDNPDIIVYTYIYNNTCYVGIDFSGFDLSKRDYKVFLNPRSLKGTIAYALIRIADYKRGEMLIDPFCVDGVIPTEAALFSAGLSPNYYRKEKFQLLKIKGLKSYDFGAVDKKIKLRKKQNILAYDSHLGNVNSAKKNAKIAGVQKQIAFSRMDIEWLDTKLEKGSVDKIVTYPPIITESNKKSMEKLYNEFFYQCQFILKKKGRVAIIIKNPVPVKEIAEKNRFKAKEELKIESGKECLDVLVFEKGA